MTGLALLAEAARAGVQLWADNGKIRYRPKSALTPDLAAKLKAGRDDVLRALTAGAPASAEEVRFWLDLLRGAGCQIELRDGAPAIEWAAGMATPGRQRDWQANLPVIEAILRREQAAQLLPRRAVRRSTPQTSKCPPTAICADPVVLCPCCSSRRVLKELRKMTAGMCYRCWEEGRS